MDKKSEIDLTNWARAQHFEFFREFYEPSYGICVRVDCTDAYRFAKENKYSFFQCCLYWTLKAAQQVDAFRLRIEDEKVFLYDHIDGGSAIDRPDGTFGYGYFPYDENIEKFLSDAAQEIAQVRNTTDLLRSEVSNIIRYSSLPWLDFTSITHAQKFPAADSCPKITFGKMTETEGRRSMPIAIHVHHGLVDGRDVGKFVELFEKAIML